MPAVGAWLATAAFPAAFGTAITYATIAKTALVVGVGLYSRRQQKKARAAALDSIKDRAFMVRSAVANRPIAYGRCRLSGPFRPVGTHGVIGEMFSFTVSLAGPIDAVEEVWFGDQALGTLDANGWTTEGDYYKSRSEPAFKNAVVSSAAKITLDHLAASTTSVQVPIGDASWGTMVLGDPATNTNAYSVATVGGVSVYTFHTSQIGVTITINYSHTIGEAKARALAFLGQAGQAADPYLLAQFPTKWTTDHRSDGASYLSCTLNYDPDVFPTGVPNVSAIVRGKRIYDPRSGTSQWSRNPALIARDYLISEFGCDSSEIDDTSVIAAANACDEAVYTDGVATQARYTFDGALDSATDRLQNLETILASMVGSAVFSAGKWTIKAGVWQAATLALDEDDLANGEISVSAFMPRRDLFNGVRGTYMEPTTYQPTDFPAYTSPTYLAQDGDDEAIQDVELPMVTDAHRAQRIAKLMLFKARQALTFSASWNLGAYEITPGDSVEITLGRYGWTDKIFRCVDREFDPAGGVKLTFVEDAETIYAWDYSEATNPDPAPNTDLPSVRTVTAPTLTFGSGSQFATVLADGSVRPFLRIYWAAVDATVERIELMWRRAHETVWQSAMIEDPDLRSHDVYGVSGSETMIVQARAINGLGVKSEWAAYSVDVDTNAPANSGGVTLGVGTNLIPNATFANGSAGWAAFLGSAVPFRDHPEPTTYESRTWYAARIWEGATFYSADNRPIPGNSLMLVAATGATGTDVASIYSTNRIPVIPAQRIEAQAWLGGVRSAARLMVLFYDSAGVFLSAVEVSGGVADMGTATGAGSLDAFDHCWGFVEAPANAASSAVAVYVSVTATGGAWVVFAQPYLGIARPGQTQPSTWSIGPAGGAIEGLDAVTEIIEATVSEQDMDASPTLFDQAFTPQYDAVVEITITAAMTGDLVNTGVGKAYCGLEVILYAGTSSGSSLVIDRSRIISWSPTLVGETHSAQGAQTITYDVNAGQLYTVKVAKFVDATKFDNVVVNSARLRITEVYR